MKLKLIAIVLSASFLGACGTIGNAVMSDDTLQDKASFALGTSPEKVTISDRKGDLDSIKFNATVGKKSYRCYVTTVGGVITSDAICSGGGHKTCDALSKAAGRCE